MSQSKLLSIIIVNWKVRDLLRECLLSVFKNTELGHDRYEVVVVDNDSGDNSAAMVANEFPEVTLIANRDNVGFGAANNQAMAYCHGEWILLLNPDTLVPPGAIDRMLKKIQASPRVAVLGCRLENGDGSLQKWTGGAFPTFWNLVTHYFFLDRLLPAAWRPAPLYLDRDLREDAQVGWVSGACMLLRRSARRSWAWPRCCWCRAVCASCCRASCDAVFHSSRCSLTAKCQNIKLSGSHRSSEAGHERQEIYCGNGA